MQPLWVTRTCPPSWMALFGKTFTNIVRAGGGKDQSSFLMTGLTLGNRNVLWSGTHCCRTETLPWIFVPKAQVDTLPSTTLPHDCQDPVLLMGEEGDLGGLINKKYYRNNLPPVMFLVLTSSVSSSPTLPTALDPSPFPPPHTLCLFWEPLPHTTYYCQNHMCQGLGLGRQTPKPFLCVVRKLFFFPE